MILQKIFNMKWAVLAAIIGLAGNVSAQTVFDFEGDYPPTSSTVISGDLSRFEVSTDQAHGGTKSLRFADSTLEPYESWTYDLPITITSGTVTVWFYDSRGASAYVGHANIFAARWGGSIILEDKNNPADFGAVEISELPYGPKYHGSEGAVNRGDLNSDRFDSDSFPVRATGHHRVDFTVTPTATSISVDGLVANEVQAPGSTGSNLRLRFMVDSPSNGGRADSNWYSAPEPVSRGKATDWLYYDDITVTAELPSPQSASVGFEISGSTPDYDSPGAFAGPGSYIPPHDNPNMRGFVNQWDVLTSATTAHSGSGSARFVNAPATAKSLVFDLTGATAGTSITLWYYDSLGQNGDRDKAGGAVILEEGANPGKFHALEITNAPYPSSGPYNYSLTTADPANFTTFYGKGFQARSTGWHKVEIGLYDTYSLISLDGQLGRYTSSSATQPGAIANAPGLDKAPRLRIMGDSPTGGGIVNYTTVDPLADSYLASRDPYVYWDDITLPIGNADISDWMNY